MEARRTELTQHMARINSVLMEVCRASAASPLVRQLDDQGAIVVNTRGYGSISRKVLTDLGSSEVALRLPVPNVNKPPFWIALHERWIPVSRHKIRFRECGLRLYVGGVDEDAVQILRLEWVAPTEGPEGIPNYQGKHAGHPHWHIDRAALVGPEDYLHSIEVLTEPSAELVAETEDFGTAANLSGRARPRFDCSWLRNIHLPAYSRWAQLGWDGRKVPGPHQNEPVNIEELANWWSGALRYFSAELAQ
jgi:hypothetical protein